MRFCLVVLLLPLVSTRAVAQDERVHPDREVVGEAVAAVRVAVGAIDRQVVRRAVRAHAVVRQDILGGGDHFLPWTFPEIVNRNVAGFVNARG
jgi:predicted ATPase